MLLSLIFNIAIPSYILMKASSPEALGPEKALVAALLFPIAYIAWDFNKRRDYSLVSILGFINVLLTGGLGLMKVEGIWFAIKEASVPGLIGAACLISIKRKTPLIYTLAFNKAVFDIEKINGHLKTDENKKHFKSLISYSTALLSLSFFLSAGLNFALAIYIIKSPTGSEAFNQELARMQILSYPVIVLPSMLMMGFTFFKLIKGVKKITGLGLEEIVHQKK
jgi:hypothetical protein